MEQNRRFPYNPQWKLILLELAVGVVSILAGMAMNRLFLAVGVAFVVLASLLVIRRVAFPRFIEINQDSLVIPRGLFRSCCTKVSYSDIEGSWETVTGLTAALHLRVKGRTFEILSMMLPNMASYIDIRGLVNSRFTPKVNEEPVLPGKYCFHCAYEGNGVIYNSKGEILFRFKTLHKRPRYPYGVFRLPDFVVYDPADNERFRVKLQRKWPLAQFVMMENGSPICTLKQRSFLRTKFTFDFAEGKKWIFRMPLFTVRFGGFSETGGKVHVNGGRTHNLWYVAVDTEIDSPQLVAALAFAHRERLRFN